MSKLRGFEIAKGWENKDINLPNRQTSGAAGYDFESAEDVEIPSIWGIHKKYKDEISRAVTKEVMGIPLTENDMFRFDFEDYFENHPEEATKTLEWIFGMMSSLNLSEEDLENQEKLTIESMLKIDNVEDKVLENFSEGIVDKFEDLKKIFKPILVPTGIKAYMQNGEYLELVSRSSFPLKKYLMLSNGIGVIDMDFYGNPDNDGAIMFQFWNFGPETITIKKGERIGQGIFLPYLLADNDHASNKRMGGHGSTGI